jgi:hypothetical protein
MVTWCRVSSLPRPGSSGEDPIANVPAGIKTNFAPMVGLVRIFSSTAKDELGMKNTNRKKIRMICIRIDFIYKPPLYKLIFPFLYVKHEQTTTCVADLELKGCTDA